MIEFLSNSLTPVILIYVVSAMLALGLSQTVKQIFDSLRNVRITLSAVVASYIILPLIAVSLAWLFDLDPALRFGLVLMSMAAGAEIGPLLTANSNGNVRLAGGLLVISIAITIVYLPVMLGVFLPSVHFPLGHLLIKLCVTVVAPLILGFFIKSNDVFHDQVNVMLMIALLVILMLIILVPLSFILKIKPRAE